MQKLNEQVAHEFLILVPIVSAKKKLIECCVLVERRLSER